MSTSSKLKKIAGLVAGLGMLLATATAHATPVTAVGNTDAFGVYQAGGNGHTLIDLYVDSSELSGLDLLLGFDLSLAAPQGMTLGITLSSSFVPTLVSGPFIPDYIAPVAPLVGPGIGDVYLATLDIFNGTGSTQTLDIMGALWLLTEPLALDFGLSSLTIGAGASQVPEPGTWILMGTGLLLMIGMQRRKMIGNPVAS